MKQCAVCSTPINSRSTYCSPACRQKAYRERIGDEVVNNDWEGWSKEARRTAHLINALPDQWMQQGAYKLVLSYVTSLTNVDDIRIMLPKDNDDNSPPPAVTSNVTSTQDNDENSPESDVSRNVTSDLDAYIFSDSSDYQLYRIATNDKGAAHILEKDSERSLCGRLNGGHFVVRVTQLVAFQKSMTFAMFRDNGCAFCTRAMEKRFE